MLTFDATEKIAVAVPVVWTYVDSDIDTIHVIDLRDVSEGERNRMVTRALDYGWGRSLNDAKGSSESKTLTERVASQLARWEAIMACTWAKGGGGGAKADPVFVEVRAIIVVKTKKTLGKVAKRFKSLAEVRAAYGDTVTDMWVAAAEKTIANRAKLGDADDILPDVFDEIDSRDVAAAVHAASERKGEPVDPTLSPAKKK